MRLLEIEGRELNCIQLIITPLVEGIDRLY
jgi:hypothetical protein